MVDAHTHVGIYAPLRDDAVTESQAAVTGGVTTALTCVRTGQYYLNRGGPYGRVSEGGRRRMIDGPRVVGLARGRGLAWPD